MLNIKEKIRNLSPKAMMGKKRTMNAGLGAKSGKQMSLSLNQKKKGKDKSRYRTKLIWRMGKFYFRILFSIAFVPKSNKSGHLLRMCEKG